MLDLDRLTESFDWIDLGFVEREATPKPAMKLGIRLHVAGLSLSDTVSVLDAFGDDRHRTTVHNWVQKTGQRPAAGRSPNRVAVDETVIWINEEQYWQFAAVDPETNHLLHVRLFPTRTTVTTRMFLAELREKHQVDDATFLVDRDDWLHAPSTDSASDFDPSPTEIGTRSNVSSGKTPNQAVLQPLRSLSAGDRRDVAANLRRLPQCAFPNTTPSLRANV